MRCPFMDSSFGEVKARVCLRFFAPERPINHHKEREEQRMGISEDMRAIAEGIICSYEMRMKSVTTLVEEVARLVENFHLEHEKMASQLKENLARGECLRKKDFDTLMRSIRAERLRREREVRETLQRFRSGEERMVMELKETLNGGAPRTAEDFTTVKERILTQQAEREKGVSEMLKVFQREQEEMSVELKKLLSKGESIRIKDFKALIKDIQAQQNLRESQVGKMLEEFRRVRESVDSQWQRLESAVAERNLTLPAGQ